MLLPSRGCVLSSNLLHGSSQCGDTRSLIWSIYAAPPNCRFVDGKSYNFREACKGYRRMRVPGLRLRVLLHVRRVSTLLWCFDRSFDKHFTFAQPLYLLFPPSPALWAIPDNQHNFFYILICSLRPPPFLLSSLPG